MRALCWIRTLDYQHELALRLNSLYVVITTVIKMAFNPLKPSGYYMYHQFNIHKFYVPPTQFIYVFCVDLGKYSDYFPVRH